MKIDSMITHAQEMTGLFQRSLNRQCGACDPKEPQVSIHHGGQVDSLLCIQPITHLYKKGFKGQFNSPATHNISATDHFITIHLDKNAIASDFAIIDADFRDVNQLSAWFKIYPSLKSTFVEASGTYGKWHIYFRLPPDRAREWVPGRTLSIPNIQRNGAAVKDCDILNSGTIFSGYAMWHKIDELNPTKIAKNKAKALKEFKAGNKKYIHYDYRKKRNVPKIPTARKKPKSLSLDKLQEFGVFPNGRARDCEISTISDSDLDHLLQVIADHKQLDNISEDTIKASGAYRNAKQAKAFTDYIYYCEHGDKVPVDIKKEIADNLILTTTSVQGLRNNKDGKLIDQKHCRIINGDISIPMPVVAKNYEFYLALACKVYYCVNAKEETRERFIKLFLENEVIPYETGLSTDTFFEIFWNFPPNSAEYEAPHGYSHMVSPDITVEEVMTPTNILAYYKSLLTLDEYKTNKHSDLHEQLKIGYTMVRGDYQYVTLRNFEITQPYKYSSTPREFLSEKAIINMLTSSYRKTILQDDEKGVDLDTIDNEQKRITSLVQGALSRVRDSPPIQLHTDLYAVDSPQMTLRDNKIMFNQHKKLPTELITTKDAEPIQVMQEKYLPTQDSTMYMYKPQDHIVQNPIYKAIRYTLPSRDVAYYELSDGSKLDAPIVLELHLAYLLFNKVPLGHITLYSNKQGTGKSTITSKICSELLFGDLSTVVTQQQLVGRFTPHIHKYKLVIIEESMNTSKAKRSTLNIEEYNEMLKRMTDVGGVKIPIEYKGGDKVDELVDVMVLATTNNRPDSIDEARRAIVMPAQLVEDNADGTNDADINAQALALMKYDDQLTISYAKYLRGLMELTMDNTAIHTMLFKKKPTLHLLEEDASGELIAVKEVYNKTHNYHVEDALNVILTGNYSILNDYRSTDTDSDGMYAKGCDPLSINMLIDKYISSEGVSNKPWPCRPKSRPKGLYAPMDFVQDILQITQKERLSTFKEIKDKLPSHAAEFEQGYKMSRYSAYSKEVRDRLGYPSGSTDIIVIKLI
jgi:hypothetical protein